MARGFTLVELLIVIVVIAILATITIVAYSNITGRAHIATLQGDLSQAATTLGTAQATNGTYPANQSSAGLKSSPGDTLTYNASGDGSSYCLEADGYSLTYVISSDNTAPRQGYCSGTVAMTGNPPVVSTLAGSTSGYADGTGTTAQFSDVYGIATDTSGNIYVTDVGNSRVRKITPSGVVTTLAGSGVAGYADGTGTAAQFNFAYSGLAVDSSGNVYVADGNNNRVRKITPAGVVTTLAGSGSVGFADGVGSTAMFNQPQDVAVDAAGNVYVTDLSNQRIRKITPSGVVSTFAGSGIEGFANGTGTAAQFNYPNGIAIDSAGNLYVTDTGSHQDIRKITPSGIVTTLAGDGTYGYKDGAAAAAEFANPYGITVSSAGTIYVADSDNNRIRVISTSGIVSTLAGNDTWAWKDGTASVAEFNWPTDITVDPSGNLYVSDLQNYRIRKISF